MQHCKKAEWLVMHSLRDSCGQLSVVDLCAHMFMFHSQLVSPVTCIYNVHLCDFRSFVIRISARFCDVKVHRRHGN